MKLKDIMPESIPPIPAKTYLAVIVGVYEIGRHYSDRYKNYSYKVIFEFDIPSIVDPAGKPKRLSKWLTPGKKKGCEFLRFFSGLDDCNYSSDDVEYIDPKEYLGRPCQIRVTVNTEKQKNNIDSVMTLPDGIQPPATNTQLRYYSTRDHGFSGKEWDSLPEWVSTQVKKSKEYQELAPDTVLDMPAESTTQEGACPI